MGVHSDVAIAVTDKVDKLMRETLNALAHGHDAISMLDNMFKETRDGWKLYHEDSIKWYHDTDPAIKLVHDFLCAAVEDNGDDDRQGLEDQITYMILCTEYVSSQEMGLERYGEYADPFDLGYCMELTYEKKES